MHVFAAVLAWMNEHAFLTVLVVLLLFGLMADAAKKN